ncbi:MAG: ATP-binding protein, partial [Mariprofundaceae bacterium]|nr:ATP-binding protein [Mariprofundaceae bacterium]
SNAVRHTEKGKVLLAVRRGAGHLRIEVWDTGPGIAEEKREAIFSEFYQLNNPERDREKGLGLGLAIVKRLSLLLDHSISLKSVPGRGSCFRISLQACLAGDQCTAPAALSVQRDIAGMFVLLIDDDASILDAMRHWLRARDCEVLAADSGPAMLAELNRLDYPLPDVIVSDYRLANEENGVLLVKNLRQHFGASVPAIVISGDTAADVIAEVKEGRCLFLPKPVQESKLLKVLSGFMPA